jgi:hypothetical protein
MQQLPPFPDDAPGFEPSTPSEPAQPSVTPQEAPPMEAPIDVPSPSDPGTDAPATPISPVG